jgi:hypothetical protein
MLKATVRDGDARYEIKGCPFSIEKAFLTPASEAGGEKLSSFSTGPKARLICALAMPKHKSGPCDL